MVVIYSITNDGSTSEVIKWIKSFSNQRILRINTNSDNIKLIRFDESSREFLVTKNDEVYNLYDAKSYWYRKGGAFCFETINSDLAFYKGLKRGLTDKLRSENNSLGVFMNKFLESSCLTTLGSSFNATPNKLHVLELAKSSNLQIPTTFVLNTKRDLERKIEEHEELITKAISDGIYVYNPDYSFYSYTELINKNSLGAIPETFHPSLFQVKINKKFEIRTFYLNGEFYSMAIFSQNSQKTKIDFRKYDGLKPNRTIPYRLPPEVEAALENVLSELELNTASIDLIVNDRDEYVFLEINPVGQFSMVSYPCNYNLEKKVADYILQN